MKPQCNPLVGAVNSPPIAEAQAWIRGRRFPPEKPLLDLAQAVPSYAPAEALTGHVAKVAGEAGTSVYSEILGIDRLRAVFASHLGEDYEASVNAQNVAITSGCNQAFCVAVSALAGRGDEIIVADPYYFNHVMWLQMQGIEPVYLPFDAEYPGRLNVDSIRALISPRTRAMVLVSPCNPTGAEYSSADVKAVHQLLSESGASLIIDETYKDFRAATGPSHTLMSDGAHTHEGLVQLFSFSKAYSMTGYRVGAIVCNARLLMEVEKILDCIAICPPRISQEAAVFALEHLGGWRSRKAELMRDRVDALRRGFAHSNLSYRLISSGAYFAYVRHPFGGTPAVNVARRLAERANVLCLPGSYFGPQQEDYLRFAFANLESAKIQELVDRLLESQTGAW
jgi:aspartate/methionine/tyrosine aminotransferase